MYGWEVIFKSLLVFLWVAVLLVIAFCNYKTKSIRRRMFLVALMPYFIFLSQLERWWLRREYVGIIALILCTISVGIIAFQGWLYRKNAYNPL